MKRLVAMILACMTMSLIVPLARPDGALARGGAIPLESLSPLTSKTSQILTADNPGHFSKSPLTHGIGFGDKDAYAEYALNGRYATLSGTLYSDDTSSNNTATILFVDASGRDPKVLLRADVPQQARKAFRLSVRGVGRLLVQQVKCCGIFVDVLATLTPGPRIPTPPFRGTALESQTLDTSQSSQPLTFDNPGHFTGALITNGFQLSDNASAVYALDRRYATLSGTLYNDDASSGSSNVATVVIANAGTAKVLLRVDVPLGTRKAFRFSLQGASRLEVEQPKCCGLYVDVVAAVTR